MIAIIYTLTISTLNTQNVINNNCNFDIVRMKKTDVQCINYGKYVNYCTHYSRPNEIIITNEKGINNSNIVIKPTKMWQEIDFNKYKMADFYYTFTCNNEHGTLSLIQHIVPTSSYDVNPFYMIIFIIIILIMFMICCIIIPDNNNSSDFLFGYFIGSTSSSSSSSSYNRIYCD